MGEEANSLPFQYAYSALSMSSDSLHNAFTDPILGLYTSNSSAPLEARAGLRDFYEFGLYSYCAHNNDTRAQGACTNRTTGRQFHPYDAIRSDMAANYSRITEALLVDTTFQNSRYLGQSSRAAFWMLLLGSVCAALSLVTSVLLIFTYSHTECCSLSSGILKNHLTFFVSTIFSILGSLFLLIGASIWTVLINKTAAVNDVLIGQPPVPVGIVVTVGSGLFLIWAAFACMVVSVVPYLIRCALPPTGQHDPG